MEALSCDLSYLANDEMYVTNRLIVNTDIKNTISESSLVNTQNIKDYNTKQFQHFRSFTRKWNNWLANRQLLYSYIKNSDYIIFPSLDYYDYCIFPSIDYYDYTIFLSLNSCCRLSSIGWLVPFSPSTTLWAHWKYSVTRSWDQPTGVQRFKSRRLYSLSASLTSLAL